MFGPILVFVGVLVIVFTFMRIAHSFLRASEEPLDITPQAIEREREQPADTAPAQPRRRPEFAH